MDTPNSRPIRPWEARARQTAGEDIAASVEIAADNLAATVPSPVSATVSPPVSAPVAVVGGNSNLATSAGEAMLGELTQTLFEVNLPLEIAGVEAARQGVRNAGLRLEDHVIPRYRSLDAPLLAVVGGSTGAGKSTLVNALVGHPVTRVGAVRPTTRQPILLHNPRDAHWFQGRRILPGLARVTGSINRDVSAQELRAAAQKEHAENVDVTSLLLVADAAVDRGVALLDAPDIDSVSAHNRRLARQLLRAADLWVFVTTANRYADAAWWNVLAEAARRDITVVIVLSRVPKDETVRADIAADLRQMLAHEALTDVPLFVIHEEELDERGMISSPDVDALRSWLHELAADPERRLALARRTLAGALGECAEDIDQVIAAMKDQNAEREHLSGIINDEISAARQRIEAAMSDGSLLRGEVLARWQDVVGTGEFFRGVESWFGRFRDRVGEVFTGRPAAAIKVEHALETGLKAVIVEESAKACENIVDRWQRTTSAKTLLQGKDLARIPIQYGDEVSAAIRAWQSDVLELVNTEGINKRAKARILSLGVNVVGIALMVVVFASTAFIPTGLEVGAGATVAVVGQKLLETIFGDDAVRRLTKVAREKLVARLDGLLQQRAAEFQTVLADAAPQGNLDKLIQGREQVRELAQTLQTEGSAAARTQPATTPNTPDTPDTTDISDPPNLGETEEQA